MTKLFFGGVPTAPDVKRLHEAFGVPAVGEDITHEQIEVALDGTNLTRHDTRYRTITLAWRSQLFKDSNVEVIAVPGVGFRCLEPNERVDESIKTSKRGLHRIKQGGQRMQAVPTAELDAIHSAKRDHALKAGALLLAQGHQMMRELATPKPVAQVKRIEPKAGAFAA